MFKVTVNESELHLPFAKLLSKICAKSSPAELEITPIVAQNRLCPI